MPDPLFLSAADPTQLIRAIESLPEHERLVLQLLYCEDLTVIEVAAVLNMQVRDVLLSHYEGMKLLHGSLHQA